MNNEQSMHGVNKAWSEQNNCSLLPSGEYSNYEVRRNPN